MKKNDKLLEALSEVDERHIPAESENVPVENGGAPTDEVPETFETPVTAEPESAPADTEVKPAEAETASEAVSEPADKPLKKNEKLLDTLGEVDDKHIPDTGKKRSVTKLIPFVGGIAAAAVIGVFAFNAINTNTTPVIDEPPVTSVTTEAPDVTDVTDGTEPPVSTDDPVVDDVEITFDRGRKRTVITDIKANTMSGDIAMADTSFTIRSNADLSADEIMSRLSITPAADYEITRSAECEYLLKARTAFAKGTVVKLSVESEEGGTGDSYAFQIIDDFRVLSVYPFDGSTYVNGNSGIEIRFSEAFDPDSAKDYFTIKPEVKGSFKKNGNTLCFAPEENMTQYTRYTVTIAAGYKALSGNTLAEDVTFSFTTTGSGESICVINGRSETFIEGDPVVIEVTGVGDREVDTKLYKYSSGDDYYADLKRYNEENEAEIVSGRMTEVFSSNEVPMKPSEDDWRYRSFIMLPDDLAEGYYVAQLTYNKRTVYYFIQMNPVSVYSSTIGDKTLFFVNDAMTGKAAVNAHITLHMEKGDKSAVTDADGLAIIDTGDNCNRLDMLEITYDGHRYIDTLMNYSIYKQTYSDKYLTYIYTDREAYQTTDTINVWGAVIPRRKGTPLPDNLYIGFGKYYNSNGANGMQKKLTLNADGTFTASFEISNISSGWGSWVSVLDGDNNFAEVSNKSVIIMDYVKPTYTFDITAPDYVVMPQEEPFDLSIDAHYFDGSPAKDLKFDSNALDIVSGNLTTDESGNASVKTKLYDVGTWYVQNAGYSIELAGIENMYQYSYNTIPAFYRDVMLTHEVDTDAKTCTVNVNKMNFDRIPEFLGLSPVKEDEYLSYHDEYYVPKPYDYEILRGEAYDVKVSVRVRHMWSEAVEAGTFYNFLEKRTEKIYNYQYHDDDLGTYSINTSGGIGVFENLPFNDERGSYELRISYNDSHGNPVELYTYVRVGGNQHNYYYTDTKSYTFDYSSMRFTENSDISFRVFDRNRDEEEVTDGKVLFIASQNDFMDTIVYDSTTFSYKVGNRHTPSFYASGAYFDGRHIFPVSGGTWAFDPKEREVKLDVKSDRDKYDAGDEVTLTVTARDINGNPVSGAALSLSVVDEAAFAVMDQHVNILSNLYRTVYYRSPYAQCSYIQHVLRPEGAGEKGGGGDEGNVRKDFRDNPYFGAVTTDANGVAVIKFKLADTITTWRATVQTVKNVNERVYAGNTAFPIVATRPVFVTPIMLSEYTSGDDIAITAKCFGLRDTDMIEATLSGSGQDKTMKFLPCSTANFGKLPVGEYTVTFRASNGENSDAMQLPLSVVETKQEVRIGNHLTVDELGSIKPTKWPATISFFDKEYLFCRQVLENIAYYGGDRLDMQAASHYALNELGWSESDYKWFVKDATNEGGAHLMPNSSAEVKVTAMLCAAFPESVSTAAVEDYFSSSLQNVSVEDMTYCYLGLASIGKPVLSDIKRAFEEYDDRLSFLDKMTLTAALAIGGDFGTAYEKYTELTADMEFYEAGGTPYAYLGNEAQTRTALMVASIMDLPEAEPLARGLMTKKPMYDSYALELVMFVRNYVPKISGDASFSYMLDGERKTVTLGRYATYTMMFDEEHFKNADFRQESGNVLVYAAYTGRVNENRSAPSLEITKSYIEIKSDEPLEPGSLINVVIHTEPYVMVDDIIPSCARYYHDMDGAFCSNEGQRVTLWSGRSGTVRYQIRITTSGDFATDSAYAYVYSGGSLKWGISDKGSIKIGTVNDTI